MSEKRRKLRRHLNKTLRDYPNSYRMSQEKGWCHGKVYRCLNGGYSPSLYKEIFPPEPRPRFTCEDPDGEITRRTDTLRGEKTRAEFMAELLELWEGNALLRY
jgi:hypothetical protein